MWNRPRSLKHMRLINALKLLANQQDDGDGLLQNIVKDFLARRADEFSEDDVQKHHGGRTGCVVGGGPGICGSKVCLGGNARCAIPHRTAQANKCLAKWRTVLRSSWLPRVLRLDIVKTTVWQAFHWSASGRQNCELECENGGKRDWCEEAAAGMDRRWRLWYSTGPLDRKVQRECSGMPSGDRVLSWAGHVARMDYSETCAKALRCRGFQWWRWRQVQRKEVETDK